MTSETPAAWRPIAGPRDVESFVEAQGRQRRASWRLTAWAGAAAAVVGIPLSVVMAPIALALGLLGYDVARLFLRLPDPFVQLGDRAATDFSGAVGHVVFSAAGVVLLVVPGAVVLLGCWLGIRRMLHHAGAGSVLVAGSRPHRAEDAEERQLQNLVEAVSLATGSPAPKLRIIDSPVPNAAMAGHSSDDAVVVVTTALLTELDRTETEGIVAHVLAAIGNGDLRRAQALNSLQATLGFVEAVLAGPASPSGRTALKAVRRYVFRRGDATTADVALHAVLQEEEFVNPRGCLRVFFVPITPIAGAFRFTRSAVGDALVWPIIRRRWRRRVLLADATAVELTRYPAGLAKGLADLAARGGIPDGVESAADLFVVGPDASAGAASRNRKNLFPSVADRVDRLAAVGSEVEIAGPPAHRRRLPLAVRVVGWPIAVAFYTVVAALVLGISMFVTAVSGLVFFLYFGIPVAAIHAVLVQLAR